MPQFIDIQFKSIIASESINQKLIEIIGQNSIFHGYRVIPGAARSITINHGTDSNSVLYIEGARILETDPIANIAIAANGTGSARTDTLYARYVHGDGAVCEYLIAQGATMPPSALFSCKLAEIDVPPGAVTISAGNIRMERQVSSLREVDAAVASHLAATNNPHAVTIGQIGAAAAAHAHGAITTAGAIGSTANLPVITAASGVLAAGAFGSTINTFCQGNDARLSDARTPVAHNQDASTITTGTLAVARGGTGIASYTANNYIRALNSTTLEQRTPAQVLADIGAPTAAHAHGAITTAGAIGSTANLPVITAASGVLAAGAFGSTANTFCQGNDARLSDARTPLTHTHAEIAAHTSLTNNPHAVTHAQVNAPHITHTHSTTIEIETPTSLPATFTRNSTARLRNGTLVNTNLPRFETGRFGQAVMVEGWTTNLISPPRPPRFSSASAPSTIQWDIANNFRISGTDIIQGGLAFAVQPTNLVSADITAFTLSIENPVNTFRWVIQLIDVNGAAITTGWSPAEWTFNEFYNGWHRPDLAGVVQLTFSGLPAGVRGIGFGVRSSVHDGGQVCSVDRLQIEARSYATSFIDGTRAGESITVPTTGIVNPAEGTIEFWWQPINQPASNMTALQDTSPQIMRMGAYANDNSWVLWNWAGSLLLLVRGAGHTSWTGEWHVISDSAWHQLNRWYHISIRWSGTNTFWVFVDGVRHGPYVSTHPFTGVAGNVMELGGAAASGGANAFIDDLRISNRARTDQEIVDAFASNQPLPVDASTTYLMRMDGNIHRTQLSAGLTALPTPRALIARDDNGRAQVASPVVAADIARLDTVTAHTALTNNPHGVTAAQVGAPALTVNLATSIDLNTVVTSGFYRINASPVNAPPVCDWGQMIVSHGGDTILQIVTGHNNNEYYLRQASGIGATPIWQPWRRLWHDGNLFAPTRRLYTGDETEKSHTGTVLTTIMSTRVISSSSNAFRVGHIRVCAELLTTAGIGIIEVWTNGSHLFTLSTSSTSYVLVQGGLAVSWADNTVNTVEIRLRNSASNITRVRTCEIYVEAGA